MGAGASVPEKLDEAAAKGICADKFDQATFDSLKSEDGTITKEQFEAASAEAAKAAPVVTSAEASAAPAETPVSADAGAAAKIAAIEIDDALSHEETGMIKSSVDMISKADSMHIEKYLKDETELRKISEKVFRGVDVDHSGKIELKELGPLLKTLCAGLGVDIPSEEEVADSLKTLDSDGDQVVSLDEFIPLVKDILQQRQATTGKALEGFADEGGEDEEEDDGGF